MAETITPPKPKATRSGSADQDAFAQVERWMAVIREVSNREQPKS